MMRVTPHRPAGLLGLPVMFPGRAQRRIDKPCGWPTYPTYRVRAGLQHQPFEVRLLGGVLPSQTDRPWQAYETGSHSHHYFPELWCGWRFTYRMNSWEY